LSSPGWLKRSEPAQGGAGVVFSHVNKRLILGLVAGTLTGAYLQQNYDGIPNVEDMARRFVQSIRDAMNKKKP